MKAAERAEREQRALAMFVGGATYLQIAKQLELRTASAAHKIVQKALAQSAQRRALLSDEALAIHQERQERLLLAHWGRATSPDSNGNVDHRSAEICRRILAQQARLYGLDDDGNSALPAPTPTAPPPGEGDEEPEDELSRLRARRDTGS